MNFHSVAYGVFLAAVFCLFWLTYRHRNLRTALLLVASYLFYGAFHPLFLFLIGFSTVLDYYCGRVLHEQSDGKRRKLALFVSIGANLGLLSFFKYWDWGVVTLAQALGVLGIEVPLPLLGIAVPVGISFYTFQTLSYTIDLYHRRMPPARNLLDFALFVAFFPQLVAGPIVRAVDFLGQLEHAPRFTRARLHDGLYRITLGVGKKVLIADVIGRYLVTPIYANPGQYAPELHVAVIAAFLVQVYYDFSGYTDIAIGSARLFGFDLPENFVLPLRALSVRDFWRRWHITLSTWLRDYVYFPLGGSRVDSELRITFNLMFSMILIGLWHGAAWVWVIFGVAQGVGVSVERFVRNLRGGKPWATTPLRRAVRWTIAMSYVAVTFICVRAVDVGNGLDILRTAGDRTDLPAVGWIAFASGAILHAMPLRFYDAVHRLFLKVPTVVAAAVTGVVAGVAAYLLLGETPFIYFQF